MRQSSIAWTIFAGFLLASVPPVPSAAHVGSTNPISEGWTIVPGDTAGIGSAVIDPEFPNLRSLASVQSSGFGAWEINDPAGAALRYQRSGPGAGSWILDARLRVVELEVPAHAGIQIEVANGSSRFELDFGSDDQGGALIGLVGTGALVVLPPQSAPGVHTDYVRVQLVYSAADGSADLFVNGIEVASDWAGDSSALDRVVFGDGSIEIGGRARYARVQVLAREAACRDGIDEDGDGLVDFAGGDPDCSQENDPTELGPEILRYYPNCSDGVDTDGDFLCDVDEGLFGASSLDPDSDGDGLVDGAEVWSRTLPLDPDSDGDGLDDGDELATPSDPLVAGAYSDLDGDGVADFRDNCVTHPNGPYNLAGLLHPFYSQIDTNLDGYGNRCDADYNDDGVVNGVDFGIHVSSYNTVNCGLDLTGDCITDGIDFGVFISLFNKLPGPSGLACAGTIPCRP